MCSILKGLNRIPGGKLQFVRWKHKENHWSTKKKQKTSTDRALEHFDEFYEQVFRTNWPPIRKALLSKPKYVAVVNNYSDSTEICDRLENRGAFNLRKSFRFQRELLGEEYRKESLRKVWRSAESEATMKPETKPDFSLHASLQQAEIDSSRIIDGGSTSILYEYIPATRIKGREDFIAESDHFRYYEKGKEFPVVIEKEFELDFPECLNVYGYEQENYAEFPQPKRGSTGVSDYYLMDGGSLLPVLALDLKPGCRMLDACSAPGGKSYVALQSLQLERLVCNDVSVSRTNRIAGVLKQYLYDLEERWLKPGRVKITARDARFIDEEGFDRILVDVPCTTDRHSVKEDDNNIFRSDRVKERLKLPELQSEILFNALKVVNVGGIVVYSTCSLSPIQNDGVVHMALKRLWEETKVEVVVRDLHPALQQTKHIYNIANRKLLRYGSLILPQTIQNFGPTYFCKIVRIK